MGVKYKIPDEIKEQIPEYFYYALGGECVSIFGADSLIRGENGFCTVDLCTSTNGFLAALTATCQKLRMDWLLEYQKGLDYDKSDIFDDYIFNETMKCFDKDEDANAYYKYIIGGD